MNGTTVAVCNGKYILATIRDSKTFIFFRKDGKRIDEEGTALVSEIIELYVAYKYGTDCEHSDRKLRGTVKLSFHEDKKLILISIKNVVDEKLRGTVGELIIN